jgi:phosphate uptake regulator
MKRRLVKQGTTTMMISLPSKWIKQQNLTKGDEVGIAEIEKNLIISKAEDKKTKSRTRITLLNNTESSIRTQIIAAYRAGYDILEVSFDSEDKYKTIVNTLKNYLIGFEIVKKEKNYCIVENITEPSEDQFNILIKKILYNVSLMINNTEDRLKNNTKFEDYKNIDLKAKQYQNFCKRVVAKKNPIGNNAPLFWTFLGILIHGQRELYHLNKFLDDNKVKTKNYELLNKLKQIFNLLSEGYIKKDMTKLETIHELEKQAIYNDLYKQIQTNKKENIISYHLALAVKNFYLAASPLMGLLLESSNSK